MGSLEKHKVLISIDIWTGQRLSGHVYLYKYHILKNAYYYDCKFYYSHKLCLLVHINQSSFTLIKQSNFTLINIYYNVKVKNI